MNLPSTSPQYDPLNEAQTRATLEIEDARNHKKGGNIEVGANCSPVLTDTVTGARYYLRVTSGSLVLVAA